MHANELMITEKCTVIALEDIEMLLSILGSRYHHLIDFPKDQVNRVKKSLEDFREHLPCPDIQKEVDLRNSVIDGLRAKIEELENFKTASETGIRECFTQDGIWLGKDIPVWTIDKLHSLIWAPMKKEEREKS